MQSIARVRQPLDAITLLCLALIALGWFGMSALTTRFGLMSQSVGFYQMLAVIRHPGLLFVGADSGHTLESLAFGALCLLALMAAVAPWFSSRRIAWLAGCAPLALMLFSFAVLYRGGPTWQPDADSPMNSFGGSLVRFANGAMASMSSHAASHVGVGWGSILSLTASLALAVRCCLRFIAVGASAAASTPDSLNRASD